MSGECISSFYYNASSFISNQWQFIATKLQPNSTDLPNLKSLWLQEPNFLKSTTKQPPWYFVSPDIQQFTIVHKSFIFIW